MTELAPLGTVATSPAALAGATDDEQFDYRAKQGRPSPFVEIRARNDDGLVAVGRQTMGELEVRGPWIASAYYNRDDSADRFTDDGWFRTGDIATIAADAPSRSGSVEGPDQVGRRVDQLGGARVRADGPSGGRRGGGDPRGEREVERAAARRRRAQAGRDRDAEELKAFLAPQFAKFWLPDAFEFVDAIPRTSAGKFKKSELRDRFKDYQAAE